MIKPFSMPLLVVSLMVAFAACGGSDDPEPTATQQPAETASPTPAPATPTETPLPTETPVPPTPEPTATPEGFYLPETPVTALLANSYAFKDGAPTGYLTTDLPIIAGSAGSWWYTAMDRYVVAFRGLEPDAVGPICPGASIESGGVFQFISNSPTEVGACSGATMIAADPAGAYRCRGFLVYVTEVPAGTAGNLYGTLERFGDDGTIYGVTSATRGDVTQAPPLDMTECRRLPEAE